MNSQKTILSAPDMTAQGAVDLHRHIALFRRRFWLLSGVAAVVFMAVFLVTLQMTPRYTATARVMLDPRQEKVVDTEQVLSGLPPDSSIVDTEVEVIRSRNLVDKVVTALSLDRDPEFDPEKQPGLFHGLAAQAMAFMGRPSGALNLTPAARRLAAQERVRDLVSKRLSVVRSGLTYVIDISFQSRSPDKAALIANTFADQYLAELLDAKFDATKRASDWLDSHLAGLRDQVRTAETAVETYKAQNGLMGLANGQGETITQQEISNLDTQLAAARAEEAEAEAKLDTAKRQLARGSTGEDVGEALNSQVIQDLRRQRVEASGLLADLQGRYGPRHPEMLKAERKLADIDSQIQAEIHRIISNLEAQAQVAHGRTQSIQSSLSHARETLAGNNAASVRLNELVRNAESVRTLYQSFLDRFKQTSTEEGMQHADARIVSRAQTPVNPATPNIPLNLLLGFFASIASAIGVVFLLEALESGLYTADDAERLLGIPLMGSVPLLASTFVSGDRRDLEPPDFAVQKPLSSFAEAFRNLRTSVVFARPGQTVKVVAITSALPGEGKTTTSICLGRIMALGGANTVLVDCDLRHRTVSQLLQTKSQSGLLEVLAGLAELDDVLIADAASGLKILPLSAAAFTPKDVFSSAAMIELLGKLRDRFDAVLLDTAPVLPVADTRALAAKADIVLFLTQWRKTPRKAVEAAIKQLQMLGAHLAGVALTKVDVKEQARSGYGDPGYYYKAYRRYYSS